MRRFALLAACCFVAQMSAAQAADVMDQPVFDWTGFYAGVNAGYAFGGDDRVGMNPTFPHVGDLELSGMFGGIQAGYNWQSDSMVLGLEGDFQLSGISDKNTFTGAGGTWHSKDDNNYFGTLRARAGFAADRALFYATGGLAFGDFDYRVSGVPATVDTSFSRVGYALGAGVEYAFDDAWSMKVEYLYANFGKTHKSDSGLTTYPTPDFHSVRLGLNYRF